MNNLIRTAMSALILFMALSTTAVGASPCSEAMIRAMKEEGLSESRIKSICARAESYAKDKSSVFTPEKIEKDLVGRSMGTQAGVIVKTGPGGSSGPGPKSRPATPGSRSYEALVSVPLGMVFDETNILAIRVLDARITGGKARVVAHVETVSGFAGRLRLYYELIAGQWTLLEMENLDFTQQ